MMTFLRRHRGWLMIVILILSLPFILYFVKTDYSRMSSDAVATIYGRTLTNTEFQRNARLYFLARSLGMEALTQALSGGAPEGREAATSFALLLPVLRHQMDSLGITAAEAEKADYIKNLRQLRGPNGFDPQKYREVSENILPAYGFTDAQIEELAGYAIALNRIRDLITAGVAVPETESKADYDLRNSKIFAQAIRIRSADFLKEVKLSDEDVKKYFDTHASEFKTDEKRKVDFVALTLTDEQKKLQGKERIDVLQKLSDGASDFTQALGEKGADFQAVAAKFQLPVKTSAEFTRSAPDAQLKNDPQMMAAAFQLSAQEPNSEAIQTPDGFYVLHLDGVVEAKPLTFDEAKPKIVNLLKEQRAREMAMNKGRAAATALREAIKAGAPLKSALDKVNLKAEPVPPFTLADAFDPATGATAKDRSKDFSNIAMAAAQTQPGEPSEFLPAEDGGIVVLVEKREPPDAKKYAEERAGFEEKFLKTKRDVVFSEWMHEQERESGLLAQSQESQEEQPQRARGAAPPQQPANATPPERKS